MSEFVTADDGIKLAYERLGTGPLVLLVHGFGSSREQNWKSTGWYRGMTEAGFSLLAMDCRGHGQSDKPHDPAFYGHERMARDVIAVMDHAGLASALLCGYSMGGFIGLRLLAAHPARVTRLAVAGVGENYLKNSLSTAESRAALAEALVTPDKDSLTDPKAKMFRAFADQTGKDRFALAACMRSMSPHLPLATLAAIATPTLVVGGSDDDAAGAPEPLAAAIPGSVAVSIPGRDHMSAVGDPRTRQAVIDFFRL